MTKIPALIKNFCDALWEYDLETNQVYVYHDNMTPEFCGKWMDYDTVSALYQETCVHKADRNIWEKYLSKESLLQFSKGTEAETRFLIRFEGTRCGMQWHEVFLEKDSDHTLFLGSRDIQNTHRNASIAQAMTQDFDYVCYIDIAANSYVLYDSENRRTIVPQNASDNYRKIMHEFNRQYVVPEECEQLIAAMETDHVVRQLRDSDEYVLFVTVNEHGELFHKKLRFSYSDETKTKLLLSRVDISDIVREQRLREAEEKKRLEYLEHMPAACCMTKILLDDAGQPYDFQFTYSNRAHAELEEVPYGELVGKNFYDYFDETDPIWLQYYVETAYEGTPHVLDRYSPEIKKHLLVHTFQPETGYCGCIVQDITETRFLEKELEKSREEMRRVLESTTNMVFQYDLMNEEIIISRFGKAEVDRHFPADSFSSNLALAGLLEEKYVPVLQESLERIRQGSHNVSVNIRGRKDISADFNWYQISLFDYKDLHSHERKVQGYMQNIEQMMSQQEQLRMEAQRDPLTGVLNAREGRRAIQKRLAHHDESSYNAMFIMDVDDFKNINDTLGHLVGDETLQLFAQILRQSFRMEDVIYRLGGDEFVVFAEHIQDPEKIIAAIMSRFFKNIEKAKETHPFLNCSVGVYVSKIKREFEDYYVEADKALYQTKQREKGYYTVTRQQ